MYRIAFQTSHIKLTMTTIVWAICIRNYTSVFQSVRGIQPTIAITYSEPILLCRWLELNPVCVVSRVRVYHASEHNDLSEPRLTRCSWPLDHTIHTFKSTINQYHEKMLVDSKSELLINNVVAHTLAAFYASLAVAGFWNLQNIRADIICPPTHRHIFFQNTRNLSGLIMIL